MGNIANKIDAKDKKISEVLTGQRYRIDSFQREYRWQRKQIEALISDLVISFKKSYKPGDTIKDCGNYDCYYMGPIVLCESNGELSIVDGQQRLTSFTLLFIFLNHQQNIIKKENSTLKIRDLLSFLYVTKAGETTLVLNVNSRNSIMEQLINNPIIEYSDVQELEKDENIEQEDMEFFTSNDESIQNLLERYEDINQLFPEDLKKPNLLTIFVEWVLEKVVMVEVKAFSLENAYTIFETMNDRGMTLNPTEILKAYLLHKINDEIKSEEANNFWKERIASIKSTIGFDSELEFFRVWLRAKYAESKRDSKQGAENEDFELIGTQFHAWVKNNPEKLNLNNSLDYYFLILSDFDFFSNLYKSLFELKNKPKKGFESLYCSNFYPIADSLSYPLLIAPILKLDDNLIIDCKIKIVSKFIDIYTISRVLLGKAVTQSTIRSSIYELIKSIRNLDMESLKKQLSIEIEKLYIRPNQMPFKMNHKMDNWGFFHYLFARLHFQINENENFSSLLRSKKQSSLILYKIFEYDNKPESIDGLLWTSYIDSVAGYCLVKRNQLDNINSKKGITKIKYLNQLGFLPEMKEYNYNNENIIEFIHTRDIRLREQIDYLLDFDRLFSELSLENK